MGFPKVEISSEHKEVLRPVMASFVTAKEKFKYAHGQLQKEINSLNETSKLIGGAMGLNLTTDYMFDPTVTAFRDRAEVIAEDSKLLQPPGPIALPPTPTVKLPVINVPTAPEVAKQPTQVVEPSPAEPIAPVENPPEE